MADFTPAQSPGLKQIDALGNYEKVQNILIQRQEQEARRRALQGGAAAGAAAQGATDAGGTLDPQAAYEQLKQLDPGAAAEAYPKLYQIEQEAIKTRSAGATANQGYSVATAQGLAPLFATHPNGISARDMNDAIGDLNARGIAPPAFTGIIQQQMAGLTDQERSIRLGQYLTSSLKDAAWTTLVDWTDPKTMEKKRVPVASIISQSVAPGGGPTPETPPPAPGEEPAPGSVPAEGPPAPRASGIKAVTVEPSPAKTAVAQRDAAQAKLDMDAGDRAVDITASLSAMLTEAHEFSAGRPAEAMAPWIRDLNALTGSNYEEGSIAAREAFHKAAAAVAQMEGMSSGGGTDMGRGLALEANAGDATISKFGKDLVINMLIGKKASDRAKGLMLRSFEGDTQKISDFYRDWNRYGDPRVFQLAVMPTPEMRAQMLGAEWIPKAGRIEGHWVGSKDLATGKRRELSPGEAVKLRSLAASMRFAQKAGWLDMVKDFQPEGAQ